MFEIIADVTCSEHAYIASCFLQHLRIEFTRHAENYAKSRDECADISINTPLIDSYILYVLRKRFLKEKE